MLDYIDTVLVNAMAMHTLQLGAVTGKLCFLHNQNMNEFDVTCEPS